MTTAAGAAAKKALIVFGGWDGHQPVQCKDRFAAWLRSRGWEVETRDTLDAYLDKDLMASVKVILPLWTMGQISGDQSRALQDAVRGGVGLAGWHGGMCDAFRNDTGYQFMTGGQWVSHPGGIVPYTVNITAPKDPIVQGLRDFQMTSEQYYMHTDPGNEVLATTIFPGTYDGADWIKGTVMPVVWKRRWGQGLVFYTSLGHVDKDFDVPEAFEIVKRGVQWAAKLPIVSEFASK